jgi:hypothetical protein
MAVPAAATPAAKASPIPAAPLRALCEDERFRLLDRQESYFRATQDTGKRYNWDGQIDVGAEATIRPGWVVPYHQRRPTCRYDMAKLIVRRTTSMVFGQDRFPEIRIEGDPEAEDYAQALATEARLAVKMGEARNLGGAVGTAVLTFGFRDGLPRVHVHNAKHILVLQWDDFDERRPAVVLKAYSSPRQVYDAAEKRTKRKEYWTVTVWTMNDETIWRDIPEEVAALPNWQMWPRASYHVHGYGFCPVYWIQNRPCSEEVDGEGDYEGQETTLDEINRLLSATTKGTIANVDPTLVVKMDPAQNTGEVFKGSSNALFSPGGAEYLELKGTAVQTAERQLERLRAYVLDVAGVVMADPEKLAGAAQSAKALEILYQPMLANCDELREQYGEHGIKPMLRDMLRVARAFLSAPAVTLADGSTVQSKVILPPKVETTVNDDGSETVTITERTPGTSENISLNWRPYFAATWDDIVKAATGIKTANGGRPTISQRTGVQAIAPLLGVKNVDAEMAQIEEEDAQAAQKQMDLFSQQTATAAKFDPGAAGGAEE